MDHEKIESYHVRLFAKDKEELERRARETGASWVAYLRTLVRRALQRKEVTR